MYFGSYGESLKKHEDGKIEILDPKDPTRTYNYIIWEISFGDMGPYYVSKEFEKNIIPNDWVLEKKSFDDVYKPYIPAEDEVYPPVTYTKEHNEELSILRTDIDNIINEKIATWITGESDIDAEWDEYIQGLKKVGLDRAMEIYNEYWQQYKSMK